MEGNACITHNPPPPHPANMLIYIFPGVLIHFKRTYEDGVINAHQGWNRTSYVRISYYAVIVCDHTFALFPKTWRIPVLRQHCWLLPGFYFPGVVDDQSERVRLTSRSSSSASNRNAVFADLRGDRLRCATVPLPV